MFHDLEDIHEAILPSVLSSNVRIIVSIASGQIADRFTAPDSYILHIDELSLDDSLFVLELQLKKKNRCISSELQQVAVKKAVGNGLIPLKIKLISEICAKWHSSEKDVSLPNGIEELILKHLSDMSDKFGHDRKLIRYSLALVCASPYGITEDELQQLLLGFDKVKDRFDKEDRYNHDSYKLPFVIWS